MIDAHIIILPSDRKDWLELAAGSIDCNCAVYFVNGELGNIAKGRVEGYSQGDYPYVLALDSDDYLLPETLSIAKQFLDSRPDINGVKLLSQLVDKDSNVLLHKTEATHPVLYRREIINKQTEYVLKWPLLCDFVLQAIIKPYLLPIVGLVHRVYQSTARAQIALAHEEVARFNKEFRHEL